MQVMPPTIGLGKAVMPKTVRRRTTDSLTCGWAGWRPALRAPRGETGFEYTPAERDSPKFIVFLVAPVVEQGLNLEDPRRDARDRTAGRSTATREWHNSGRSAP